MGKLSAALLSADLARLAEQVKLVEAHADLFHIDISDAHFVTPLSVGPVVVASLRPHTTRPLHGHLMVEGPEGQFDDLAEAGADAVTVHVEAVLDLGPVIAKARGAGLRVGLALDPGTEVETLAPHLEEIDDVTVLGGPPNDRSSFLPGSFPRVEAVRAEVDRRGLAVEIQVEGGVKLEQARRCVDAGATVLVVGSGIFQADDVSAAARELKTVVEAA